MSDTHKFFASEPAPKGAAGAGSQKLTASAQAALQAANREDTGGISAVFGINDMEPLGQQAP